MRRKDREVSDFHRIVQIIDRCDILRLGLADGEFPYVVPVNFAYTVTDDRLEFYIHGAMAGRKYELLQKNGRCSFELDLPIAMECLPEQHDVTMRFQSVMGTAKITLLEGDARRQAVDDIILNRYDFTRNFPYSTATLNRTAVARLTVLTLTGKENLPGGGPD